jgi:hypothetical protein
VKTNSPTHWCAAWLATGLLAALAALPSLPANAADPDPAGLREEVQRLERKAQELKADGQQDQAHQVMRQMAEIRAQIEKLDKGPANQGQATEVRRLELKRALEEARADLKELTAAGQEDKAAAMKQRIRKLEEERASLDRRPARDKASQREGMEPRRRLLEPSSPPEAGTMEQRLRHLQAAIENLHAAGLHEPAEQLSLQAAHLKQEMLAAQSTGARGPAQPGDELQRLRAEVQELRQVVRELRARVEELGRERR